MSEGLFALLIGVFIGFFGGFAACIVWLLWDRGGND